MYDLEYVALGEGDDPRGISMQPTEIFFSYAHEDENLMNDVRRQFIVYDRQNEIVKWYDRLIPAGGTWAGEIDERLHQAGIILLLVSPHFIESQYCYHVEMAEALRRHKEGQVIVIPIILRPCPWQDSPIGHLKALPKDGKAITLWENRDEACLEVAKEVMKVVRGMSSQDAAPADVAPSETSLPSWPENHGVYIATSSKIIPLFPHVVSGYKTTVNKDYWDRPFTTKGSIRINEDDWTEIPEFPATMNSCSAGVFMIRWRSGNLLPVVSVLSSYLGDGRSYMASGRAKTGQYGYMYGSNCEQPMFKVARTPDGNNLDDIYYELKFWQAAP